MGAEFPKQEQLRELRIACDQCSVQQVCLPRGLDETELEVLERFIDHMASIPKGGHLFRISDALNFLYVVRSGTVKTCAYDSKGSERVLDFHMAGDVMGLDGIYSGRHQGDAIALHTASVCRIRYSDLNNLMMRFPTLQRYLFESASKDLQYRGELDNSLGALQRMAAFLLDWSTRQEEKGFAKNHFILPMSRRDLANFVGLAPETVSRVLKELVMQGTIFLHDNEVRLKDVGALKSMSAA